MQWWEWGWSSSGDVCFSAMASLCVPLLALSDIPESSGFFLYTRKWENWVWHFIYVRKREPQDMSLNKGAVPSLLAVKTGHGTCPLGARPSNSLGFSFKTMLSGKEPSVESTSKWEAVHCHLCRSPVSKTQHKWPFEWSLLFLPFSWTLSHTVEGMKKAGPKSQSHVPGNRKIKLNGHHSLLDQGL